MDGLDYTLRVATPRPVSILMFTAYPTIVAPKEPVTLQWKVEGDVDLVTLVPGGTERLPKEGSFGATPQQSVRYKLTAHGPGGSDVCALPPRMEYKNIVKKRGDIYKSLAEDLGIYAISNTISGMAKPFWTEEAGRSESSRSTSSAGCAREFRALQNLHRSAI